MANPCSLCRCSKDRPEIDAALVGKVSLREIARRFRVSKSAAARHRPHALRALALTKTAPVEQAGQMGQQAGRALEARPDRTPSEKFADLELEAHRLKKVAEETGDLRGAFVGLDRLIDLAKIYSETKKPTPVETREKAARYAAAVGIPVEELLQVAEELAAEIAVPEDFDLAKELKNALKIVRTRKEGSGTTLRVEHVCVPLPTPLPGEPREFPPRDDVPALPLGPRRIGPKEWEL